AVAIPPPQRVEAYPERLRRLPRRVVLRHDAILAHRQCLGDWIVAQPAAAAMPSTATATSPATRATALFTPDAIPASPGPASESTVVVSGATVIDSPTENPSSGGRRSTQ